MNTYPIVVLEVGTIVILYRVLAWRERDDLHELFELPEVYGVRGAFRNELHNVRQLDSGVEEVIHHEDMSASTFMRVLGSTRTWSAPHLVRTGESDNKASGTTLLRGDLGRTNGTIWSAIRSPMNSPDKAATSTIVFKPTWLESHHGV